MRGTFGKRSDLPTVAFGPEMPGWGSWEWVGLDLREELAAYYRTGSFRADELPDADIVVVVKHPPSGEWWEAVARRAALIYAPVDCYGAATEIDGDCRSLRFCSRILVHCERLRKYFEPFAPVAYLDHHVKFVPPLTQLYCPDGHFLWVGVRTNLPPLVEWVNEHPLPAKLCVLTNLENPALLPKAADFGFRAGLPVRILNWSKWLQEEMTAGARAALDVKGGDFRSRHKPPAKAIDFLAAGLPLAMNQDSSPVEHLAGLGFEVPSPLDTRRWLSRTYWEETQRFGRALRELLSRKRIGLRLKRVIDGVLAERRSLPGFDGSLQRAEETLPS